MQYRPRHGQPEPSSARRAVSFDPLASFAAHGATLRTSVGLRPAFACLGITAHSRSARSCRRRHASDARPRFECRAAHACEHGRRSLAPFVHVVWHAALAPRLPTTLRVACPGSCTARAVVLVGCARPTRDSSRPTRVSVHPVPCRYIRAFACSSHRITTVWTVTSPGTQRPRRRTAATCSHVGTSVGSTIGCGSAGRVCPGVQSMSGHS